MNLGRHWQGYFVYGEDETDLYPIEATLELVNGRLTGTMIDLRLEVVATVADIMRKVPVGTALYREWQQTAERYPDMIITTRGPQDATIRGSLSGHRVTFTKTYLTKFVRTTTVTGWEPIVEEDPSRPVEYRGEIDSIGREIAGTWTISLPTMFGFRRQVVATGRFRLVCRDEHSSREPDRG